MENLFDVSVFFTWANVFATEERSTNSVNQLIIMRCMTSEMNDLK